MPLDGAMKTAIAMVAGVALAMALGALALLGWSVALGVALGGLLATVNLWAFAYVGRGVLQSGSSGRRWGVLGGLKLLALLGAVYLLLDSGLVPGMALAAGYAALPLGASLANFIGPKPGEDDPELTRASGDLPADLVTGAQPDTASGD